MPNPKASQIDRTGASIVITGRGDFEQDDRLIVAVFLERARLRSPATARVYRQAIERFRSWHGDRLSSVRYSELLAYQSAARKAGGLHGFAPATVCRHLATLRAFFSFACDAEYLTRNPAKLLKLPKVIPGVQRWLTADELTKMIRADSDDGPRGEWRQIQAARNHALAVLAATTGCRSAELSGIDWADFYRDGKGRIGLLVRGKGAKTREIRILPVAWNAIAAYRGATGRAIHLDERDSRPLFLNRFGRRLSELGVLRSIADSASRSGIDRKVTPHAIRRGVATAALSGGASIRQVQAQLGHASIATTQRYLQILDGLDSTAADFLDAALAASGR